MGEAKRKSLAGRGVSDSEIKRISDAIIKLATAASATFGGDCWMHAAFGKALLEKIGIRAEIAGGEAAWRVGDGDGDVILHGVFGKKPAAPFPPGAFPYHAWLEFNGRILDLTTYQLRDKAAQLDRQDGAHTTVDWCPDFLFVEKKSSRSIGDVSKLTTGLYHYRRDLAIEAIMKRASIPIDPADMQTLELIYSNENIRVIGPMNIMGSDG